MFYISYICFFFRLLETTITVPNKHNKNQSWCKLSIIFIGQKMISEKLGISELEAWKQKRRYMLVLMCLQQFMNGVEYSITYATMWLYTSNPLILVQARLATKCITQLLQPVNS